MEESGFTQGPEIWADGASIQPNSGSANSGSALGQEEDHQQTKVGSDLQIRGLWLWKEALPVRASWYNDY